MSQSPLSRASCDSDSQTGSMESPGKKLIRLVDLPRMVFDPVHLNGLHALQRFEIQNITAFPVLVKLRSNLGSQLAFQLTNENLPNPHVNTAADISMNSSSSSFDASLQNSSSSLFDHSASVDSLVPPPTFQFNQLFNYVNHIDQVVIPAEQSVWLIAAFLPEVKSNSIPGEDAVKSHFDSRFDSASSEELNDFFFVNGNQVII